MTYFYILIFFVNGEMDHGIVTKSEQACSDLMSQHMDYPDDMICEPTNQASSSIKPKFRPATHKSFASGQFDHLAHDDHR